MTENPIIPCAYCGSPMSFYHGQGWITSCTNDDCECGFTKSFETLEAAQTHARRRAPAEKKGSAS